MIPFFFPSNPPFTSFCEIKGLSIIKIFAKENKLLFLSYWKILHKYKTGYNKELFVTTHLLILAFFSFFLFIFFYKILNLDNQALSFYHQQRGKQNSFWQVTHITFGSFSISVVVWRGSWCQPSNHQTCLLLSLSCSLKVNFWRFSSVRTPIPRPISMHRKSGWTMILASRLVL